VTRREDDNLAAQVVALYCCGIVGGAIGLPGVRAWAGTGGTPSR
jgi:hypothetical protein